VLRPLPNWAGGGDGENRSGRQAGKFSGLELCGIDMQGITRLLEYSAPTPEAGIAADPPNGTAVATCKGGGAVSTGPEPKATAVLLPGALP